VVIQGGGVNPLSLWRANTISWYWPQRAATVTSPICRPGLTPPAMPLNSTALTLKRSITSCVVMAALTIDTPLKNITTSLPANLARVNSTPLTVTLRSIVARASSRLSSCSKADITTMRGLASSFSSAWAGKPTKHNNSTAKTARIMVPPMRLIGRWRGYRRWNACRS